MQSDQLSAGAGIKKNTATLLLSLKPEPALPHSRVLHWWEQDPAPGPGGLGGAMQGKGAESSKKVGVLGL